MNTSTYQVNSPDTSSGESHLKTSNYEQTVHQLDIYYGTVKRQLLRYQSCINGLFPVVSNDLTVGSVRDSVYCAAAVWSLYQAYRRIDDDRGKSYELGQSAVKCMRGILECWIKQAPRVEQFKKNQSLQHALHCKFHLTTGAQIFAENEYNHLQIDVVSLYLIFLVQMITSGLQIVYTKDEVTFVQNLVYYVERAYRTPDFGMWERGTKYNDGSPEIHASSIGIAKSALEAINGCNLFGDKGASWSVVYVDIDAHNRNRSIFETLLPRESSSKEVDVSLLPTISFPAFASHDEHLLAKTKSNIQKLRGKYGFKRFSRDGFKCPLEDPCQRFYKEGQTKDFEGIECEWPLFYIYMIIDGVFRNLPEQVEEFQNLLRPRISTDSHRDPVIPMYFAVQPGYEDAEKAEPGSQIRRGAPSNGYHLWSQALFVIAQLLTGGLLHINELDPIRRYLPSYNRPRKGGRYSAFQGTATDLVVQVVLIAESMRLQAMMATYGIQTQTPHEVEPVQICSSSQLVKIYQHLGVNKQLGLEGRPSRPIGALGTSKIYRVCGKTVLCYPLIFEVSEFYLYRDMALLIDDIKTELQFVGRYWRLSGRPTACLLIREEHMRDPQFKEMLDLLAMLKKGHCDGLKVRVGRLQNLISSSCIEHLDFMNKIEDEIEIKPFKQIEHEYIGYQSLTDVPKVLEYSEKAKDITDFTDRPTWDIVEAIRNTDGIYAKSKLIGVLLQREGPHYEYSGLTVYEHLRGLYHHAGCLHCWQVVRYCSSLLGHTVDSISPFITAVLVHGKQLTVGVPGEQETVFDKPMTPAEIRKVLYSTVQPLDVIGAVLQQEVVLYCGRLIGTNPGLFSGILKIRVGWVLEAMKLCLQISSKAQRPVEALSPQELRQLVYKVLSVKDWAKQERLSTLTRRKLEGCLCRVPQGFYLQVWDVMQRTPQGVRVQGRLLAQQHIMSNLSRSEIAFALLVEEMLNYIKQPEYRQIVVELLCIVSKILQRNPELSFKNLLDLDYLVDEAYHLFCKDQGVAVGADRQAFYSAPASLTTGYLARATVNSVLRLGELDMSGTDQVDNDDDSCKVS
ncbi:probable phosphorylase b kinase regulatory subunit beta isoform X2 [Neocloeon triangulifer]|uniref:probable phosphorylase b kinase regulatory subunit beta isoform X2 n=1 Tax=Neocloeon triangulifer TaxID=2078957 RepID=UPI00286ED179|nr:probable phosphorylase b kinase regulatory subunit beta isoform X2 [Neocloeon triangulifer]